MLGEGIVARVVGRHSHDGTCTVASQHVFGNPDGNLLIRERIDGVASREHTSNLMIHLAVALRTLLHVVEVFLHFFLLLRRGEFGHKVALGSEHHERHTKHRVCTSGEDGEVLI